MTSSSAATVDAVLDSRIAELGPWFHNLDLDGRQTAPEHFLGDHPRKKWQSFRHLVPEDLTGMTVLDMGCNAGFFALEMKRRGAARVVAADSDPRYLAQAALASEVTGLRLELRQLSVYDVARLGRRFDLVLFLGVFYHLRHPLLALDLLHEHAVGNVLLFQSLLRGDDTVGQVAGDYAFADTAPFDRSNFPRLHFIEKSYAGDPTNWFVPNRAGAEAMLRSAGFAVADCADPDIWLCTRTARPAFTDAPPSIGG
jgi:tRNA (mo5U34)-methyltransferase